LTLSKGDSTKVLVEHFVGISPRRYRDIFEKPKKRRDGRNQVKRWQFDVPTPMVPDKTETHIAIEQQILVGFNEILEKISEGLRAAKSENS